MRATASSDYRRAMPAIWMVCGGGVVSSLWPASDVPITIGLAAAAGAALVVAALRRELRIRRVLAAIQPLRPGAVAAPPTGATRIGTEAAAAVQTSDDVREVA